MATVVFMECFVLFGVVKTVPFQVSLLTLPGAFIMYSVLTTTFLIGVYFFLPETYGLTLEQIEDIFKGKSSPNRTSSQNKPEECEIFNIEA